MIISAKSFHYRYFLFLKRFETSFSNVMDFDQSRPFDHYVFFNRIEWCSRLCTFLKVGESLLKFDEHLVSLLKNLINRILLFQFWGSLIIYSILQVFKILFELQINANVEYIFLGILPLFLVVHFIGILSTLWEFLMAIIYAIKNKIKVNRRVKQNYKDIFSYSLYVLFAPLLFLFLSLLEIFARLIVTFIYYQALGVKFFIEQIWLIVNLLILLVNTPIQIIKSMFLSENRNRNESRLKKLTKINLKSY